MKKNLLTKLGTVTVMLATCLSLFVIVLPWGTISIGDNYGVSTLADDEFEYMNHK